MMTKAWRMRSLLRARFFLLSISILAVATVGQATQRPPVKIVIALSGEPITLDGQDVGGTASTPVFAHIYDKLVEFDLEGNLVPQLATSWKVLPGGLTWMFTLRQGHKFHDGTPVNAETVKRSFERLLDEKNRLGYRSWFDMIDKVTVVDRYTVGFKTKRPHLFLAHRLASTPASIVSPTAAAKVDLKTFGGSPVGSGPYVFKEWVRGTRILLEKNPNHWLAPRLNIDVIEFRPIPEEASRAIGLETGELDFVTVIAPHEAERLRANPKLAVYNMPNFKVQGVYMNVLRRPFDDVQVRHAVAYAIDKRSIVDTFLKGYGQVADSPLQKGIWGYRGQKPFEYNPERAKELLTKAGYPNGFETTMWVPTGAYFNSRPISVAIAEMLRRVGINVRLEIMEDGQWLTLLRSKGPQESTLNMTYYGFGVWTGEPDHALRLTYHSANFAPKGLNRNFYSNAEVDALLDQGYATINDQERRRIYQRVQELVWNDQPWAYIFYANQAAVGKKSLRNVRILPTETIHFREASWAP